MKTSELIKELQNHIDMWGDTDVDIYNEQTKEESKVVNVLAGVENDITKCITIMVKN